MEQLIQSFGLDGRILLWQVINFAVLFFILARFVFRPLAKIMREREEQVRNSLDEAGRLERKTAELEADLKKRLAEERREIENMHERARETHERLKKEIKTAAEAEAKRMIDEARLAAEEEKTRMFKSLEADIKRLAVELAGKILEERLDEKKQKELLEKAFASVKKTK